jgi:hypothetical protein
MRDPGAVEAGQSGLDQSVHKERLANTIKDESHRAPINVAESIHPDIELVVTE